MRGDRTGTSIEQSVELTRHPSTCGGATRGIEVRIRRAASGDLALAFRLGGHLDRIRVPPPGAPRIGAELWRHTCFEAFIAVEGLPAYHELNFAPSTEWGAYAFRRYRDGEPLADETLAPRIAVRTGSEGLELDALVPLHRLSAAHASAPLRLGLAAVIEESDGTCSYWALRHPGGKPDFHHPDAFALRLEPPRGEW